MLREFRWVLLLVLLVLAIGTSGYRIIEGWTWLESIWMVVITLTTVGYGEPHPLSNAGRVFTIGLIAGGLFVVSYGVTRLARYVLEGELARDWRESRRIRLMSSLSDHYIVAGYGRLGREVAAEVLHAGRHVVVIDPDPTRCAACEEDRIQVIRGDASFDATLRAAGIERARGLAVASGSNAVNILVTLSAHQLNEQLLIVTRVDGDEAASKALRAGATGVMSPYGLGGTHMALGLLSPQAQSFVELATVRTFQDLAFEDVPIKRLTGLLRNLDLRSEHRVMLVAIRKVDGSLLTVPGPDTELERGDVVVAVGAPADLSRFETVA